ncbi:CgeB family protein [Euzebyella saccharophila]|uniref:Glycosyltransferase n=1 Tax=Euzebyella saccharophila TaxID=679664 RepID=A0ABV8JY55_9FLAO|nr:glycosyltransferase [Euzebyella saccharophila]
MKILYIGHNAPASTSYHRAQALERIGHTVDIINPYEVSERSHAVISKLHYLTGYRFLQSRMRKWVTKNVPNTPYDLVWVNSGELLGVNCVKFIKSRINRPVILYNNDDPTGGRDGKRFDTLLKTIPYYDMCVVMREINVAEYENLGAKRVIKSYMSYDEVIHAPLNESDIPDKFRSEVSFIGTNIPNENRDVFIHKLIKKGVPISIWGGRWDRSPYWKELKPFFRGPSLKGKEYTAAIQGAKICLGLLSKGNRDLYTRRSFEIPYVGSLFCAERTEEHLALFKENVEAIFWKDADECADKCIELLNNEKLLNQIAEQGRARVLNDKRGNEDIANYILDQVRKQLK